MGSLGDSLKIFKIDTSLGGKKRIKFFWTGEPTDPTRLTRGLAAVFKNSPGLEPLGNAVSYQVDKWKANVAQLANPFRNYIVENPPSQK